MTPESTALITAEQVLSIVHAEYIDAKTDGDRKAVSQLLPIMARMAIYLHKAKHKNNHYMTSMEALQSLTPDEQQTMGENMQKIAAEAGWSTPTEHGQKVASSGKKRKPFHQNVFFKEALQDRKRDAALLPPCEFHPFPEVRMHEGSLPVKKSTRKHGC